MACRMKRCSVPLKLFILRVKTACILAWAKVIATGIVRDHSGALKVRSEQGKGILVVIALLLTQPAQTTTELEQGQVGAD